MGVGLHHRHPGRRLDSGSVLDRDEGDRRQPRRSQFDDGGAAMNRSRKDLAMMALMGVLLLFAVYNFVFKPQQSELSGARDDRATAEQSVSDAQLALLTPIDTSNAVPNTDPDRGTSGGSCGPSHHRPAPAAPGRSRQHRRRAGLGGADPAGREPERPWRLDADLDLGLGPPCVGAGLPRRAAHDATAARDRADRHQRAAGRRRRHTTVGPAAVVGACLHAAPAIRVPSSWTPAAAATPTP